MKINQLFKAHPIGQGLFYTGKISADNDSFSFIFDCGSLSYSVLDDTIGRFRSENSDIVPLDVLVISHFDADHINGLKKVLASRKVKKIIAPFISFHERVVLALQFAEEAEDSHLESYPDELPTIIDFTSMLEENIDEAEIYFITEADDSPRSPLEDFQLDLNELAGLDNFDFRFESSAALSQEEIDYLNIAADPARIKKVSCSQKAFLSDGRSSIIMDFIFYKKKIAEKQQKFYDTVFDLFIKENENEFEYMDKPKPDEVLAAIKKLKGASRIQKLFEDAATAVSLEISLEDLRNLNTTALCMLHRDLLLKSTPKAAGPNDKRLTLSTLHLFDIQILQNREFKSVLDNYHSLFHHLNRFPDVYDTLSPDTLLTSDSFLKESDDAAAFLEHYALFWPAVSIFQIPHHGSRHSSDKILFSRIGVSRYKFINYGLNHYFIKMWSHPHNDVMRDLLATGHTGKLLPVHEHTGYEIHFETAIRSM